MPADYMGSSGRVACFTNTISSYTVQRCFAAARGGYTLILRTLKDEFLEGLSASFWENFNISFFGFCALFLLFDILSMLA
jgi:hypothetical protein